MPVMVPVCVGAGQLSLAGDVLHGVVCQGVHGQVVLNQEPSPLTDSHGDHI